MPDHNTFQRIYATREAARKMVRLSTFACIVAGKAQKANLEFRIRPHHTVYLVSSAYTILKKSQAALLEYNRYYEVYRVGAETPSAWINTRLQDFIDRHFLPDVPPEDSWFKK